MENTVPAVQSNDPLKKQRAESNPSETIPITTTEFDDEYFKQNKDKIVVKKNRYYISGNKSEDKPSFQSSDFSSPVSNLPKNEAMFLNKGTGSNSHKNIKVDYGDTYLVKDITDPVHKQPKPQLSYSSSSIYFLGRT